MSENVVVSNTPIFDQLQKEWADRGKHYQNMVARIPVVNPWPKDRVEEVAQPTVEQEDKPMTRGIPKWAIQDDVESSMPLKTAVEHLDDANQRLDSLVREWLNEAPQRTPSGGISLKRKPEVEVKHLSQISLRTMDAMAVSGSASELIGEMLESFYSAHPNGILEDVTVEPQFDGSVKTIMRGVEPVTSIGEDQAESLYMKTPNFWGKADD